MYILATFCDMHWLVSWILPFLLGLLLGWWLWSRYKKMVAELEEVSKKHRLSIKDLEAKLAECKSRRAELEGDLALAKGKTREAEAALAGLQKTIGTSTSIAGLGLTSSGGGPKTNTKTSGTSRAGYAGLAEDNLQIIEGIGPKMESVLQENDVHTWAHLAQQSPEQLAGILAKYGDRYKIIDPSTWSAQAQLAAARDWQGLSALQQQLDGGSATGKTNNDAKVDKMLVRLGLVKKYKENDLKVIEGIGPKIEKLLQHDGITTWRMLADTAVDKIQTILTAAGPRYKLADPTTWPKQAELAADAKWSELEDYQDYLQGGKG